MHTLLEDHALHTVRGLEVVSQIIYHMTAACRIEAWTIPTSKVIK
jgi:hypothetical protein